MSYSMLLDITCYKRIRHAVYEGPLRVIRDEMTSFLYKLYAFVLYKSLHLKLPPEVLKELVALKSDFMDNPLLESEISLAIQDILSDSPQAEKKKRISSILDNKQSQVGAPTVTDFQMSQYTLEVLFTYIEKENFTLLKEFMFMLGLPPINIKKELQPKELTTSGYFTGLSQDEKEAVNKKPVYTGLEKSDYAYWSKLLKSSIGSKPAAPPVGKGSRASAILPPSNEDGSQYPLSKRISLLVDQTSKWPTSHLTNLSSLTYKMEFTQNYLTTARALQQSSAPSQAGLNPILPSILKFGFEDYYGVVTVIESNVMMKAVLFGTSKGMVKCVFLSKSAASQQNESGNLGAVRPKEQDNQQQPAQEGTQAPSSGQQQQSAPQGTEEYEMQLDMLEFIGHKSPITALSLRADSSRFVSGSLDGQIRYWDITRNSCLYVIQENFQAVLSVKIAPKRDLIASSGSEPVIVLWNELSGTRNMSLIGHTNDVVCLEFAYHMRYLFSAALDCTLRVWCAATGECMRIIRTASPLLQFCVTLVGDIVVGASENHELIFIDVTRHKLQKFYSSTQKQTGPQPSSTSRIRCVTLSPDEKFCSVIRKDQVAIIPTEEIYKLKAEFEQLEKKEDEAGIRELSQRDYKLFSSAIFENEKFDFTHQVYGFHNSLVVFNRNSGTQSF